MKVWYVFDTAKGRAACLMEDDILHRFLLPQTHLDIGQLESEAPSQRIQILDREDDSLPLANKIRAYYKGSIINNWEVKLDISALPPFYRRSLEYVFTIPYGSTLTYGEVARAIGNPRAARAVGQANRNNPIPLVIPCHRVVGRNSLGGFSGPGGLQLKLEMINMEKDRIKHYQQNYLN
ncbi:MAG: methylated-DNA--[protein]-cysteine S-methyltransferase [Syntrophomonadaceae bacterium]|jgi:methylated-DNA-[protein]-cysteine S-methyltransferase|nr:MGMT family protein [Syntrophomonadaceae bacterium]